MEDSFTLCFCMGERNKGHTETHREFVHYAFLHGGKETKAMQKRIEDSCTDSETDSDFFLHFLDQNIRLLRNLSESNYVGGEFPARHRSL